MNSREIDENSYFDDEPEYEEWRKDDDARRYREYELDERRPY